MIERRPFLDFLTHVVLILGVIVVAFPVYVVFVASSLTAEDVLQAPMTLIPVRISSKTTARCSRRAWATRPRRSAPCS